MAIQTQLEYVPSIGLYLSKSNLLAENGISWYDSKLLLQEMNLVLLTSREWSEAVSYFKKKYFGIVYPQIARSMMGSVLEWTDSLIALPNSDGKYASNLNLALKQNGVLLIEHSVVEKRNNDYIITGGEIRRFDLPESFGILENPLPELGLKKGDLFSYRARLNRNLICITRSYRVSVSDDKHKLRPYAAVDDPSSLIPDLGFRPARRGLFINKNKKDLLEFQKGSKRYL